MSALEAAQHAFYNARYRCAATLALASRERGLEPLATYELRTAALLFELKRQLGGDQGTRRPLDACAPCAPLFEAFQDEFATGQRVARQRLATDPGDLGAHFSLARMNLNHLWLQNGTLGRRTGWKEYREARRSLERVLEDEPGHLRARVALAWVEYIVDTRMPWGIKWLFGGGSRARALASMEAAANADGTFYELAEARFGLWEMLVREDRISEAARVARRLASDFPENDSLVRFLAAHPALPDEARR
jgi:hypothetical protein